MKTNQTHWQIFPVRAEKRIWIGALALILASGCTGSTPAVKTGRAPLAAELAGRGGPAEGRISLRHLENFQLCAERNPQGLTGRDRLEIEVGINPAGRVLSSRVTSMAPETEGLAACVARALTWIEFERAAGTYRHYRLGLARGSGGRVRVDLVDLAAPDKAAAKPLDPARAGIPAELAEALDGVNRRD